MTDEDKVIELFCAGHYKLSYALMKGLDTPLDLSKITLKMITGGEKCYITIPMANENTPDIKIGVDPPNLWHESFCITQISITLPAKKRGSSTIVNDLWRVLNKDANARSPIVSNLGINDQYIVYSKYIINLSYNAVNLTELLNFIINYEN